MKKTLDDVENLEVEFEHRGPKSLEVYFEDSIPRNFSQGLFVNLEEKKTSKLQNHFEVHKTSRFISEDFL